MSKRKGIISRIQTFMDSPKGRTYTNYIYSWGASIVILGTLFKLTHIAGANLMLFIGMGAEVIVFFFSAFERSYELAEEDRKEERAERRAEKGITEDKPGITVTGGIPDGVTGNIVLGASSQTADPQLVSEMDNATKEYVEKIHTLNETIKRISEQTDCLGRNMEEMETLARNITGVNALFEMQLRSAGSQVGNIDLVNEETKKMAGQIKELNAMYARMIEAMTNNMHKA